MDVPSANTSNETPSKQLVSRQDQQHDADTAPASQAEGSSQSNSKAAAATAPAPSTSRTGRWIRIAVASIKAILFLELASMVARPLIASRVRQSNEKEEDTDSDLDPADVLMDYLTGRTGLAALQLLRPDQLSTAVDNLITEDFEELGVKDRGTEIRRIVDDIIQAREKGMDTPSSRSSKQSRGLGRVGPLRFRNTKQALAKEVSPPTASEADADNDSSKGSAEVK